MSTILWFKRDLRIEDSPALAVAMAGPGPVLPLYIVEPELWAQPDRSARQWRFLAESLRGLSGDLARLGAPLILRRGDAIEVLGKLRAAHGVVRLISHQETGTLWTSDRDHRVAAWAQGVGVEWLDLPPPGVSRRRHHSSNGSSRFAKAMQAPVPGVPRAMAPHGVDPGTLPDAADLGLLFDPCPGRQKGGRDRGAKLLQDFLDSNAPPCPQALRAPPTGDSVRSRLSPHLALGTLSAREVGRDVTDCGSPPEASRPRMSALAARLRERDRAMQVLDRHPDAETTCLHPAFQDRHPKAPDAARLQAWQSGETGIPFVDASMRQLIHSGWLPFRLRAMLVSVASHHLWLDWRVTGGYLARLFTDYEPGIHWPQVQRQAGVAGGAAVRVCDPVKMGRAHDPDGRFIRHWVPELRHVPDPFLHTPWGWGGAGRFLGRHYPVPIVDPVKSAKVANARMAAIRGAPGGQPGGDRAAYEHAAQSSESSEMPRKSDRQLSFVF